MNRQALRQTAYRRLVMRQRGQPARAPVVTTYMMLLRRYVCLREAAAGCYAVAVGLEAQGEVEAARAEYARGQALEAQAGDVEAQMNVDNRRRGIAI